MSGLVDQSADARSKTISGNFRIRAWVNYNAISSVIRSSGNVSTVADEATGDYTVNFASAMPDANYTVASVSSFVASGEGADGTVNVNRANSSGNEVAPTASALRVNTSNDAGSPDDMKYLNIIVVR